MIFLQLQHKYLYCLKNTLKLCGYKRHWRKIHSIRFDDVPKITNIEIRKILRQKGFSVQDGFTSFASKFAICGAEEKCGENKVYINKTTGTFICTKCNFHGEWNILERLIKKTKLDPSTKELIETCKQKSEEIQNEWQLIIEKTIPICKLPDTDVEDLFNLFEYPFYNGINKILSDVRVSSDRTVLYFPLKNTTTNIVGYRKICAGQDNAESYGLHSYGLYSCKIGRVDQAILVPKVQDLIHLAAEKVPGMLIWLDNCSLPPTVLPTLENYQKLCLWGEWDNMLSVAEKLGVERCRFVRPTDGLVTVSEAAKANLPLKDLVARAKPAAHRSITTFEALRETVLAELTNIDKIRGIKWRRYPVLTKLLGGHRRGELTVLTGPTGCGKTTLCSEMSLDLALQGVKTLWGSFEIRNARLARTMLQQFAGIPLERNLKDFNKYADEFQKLPIYYLAFHGHQPIKVVMEAVEHARYMHDIAHVVIDNVQFMLGLGEERDSDRYYRQDAVIAAFRSFATARHCHVTLVMHPRKERDTEDLSTSSIFGSAKASQEADNVLIVQDKRLTAVRGKKYLQVAKNRYTGDLGVVPLDFDKDSLSYQPKKKNKKQEDPEKLLTQCFEGFSIDEQQISNELNDKQTKIDRNSSSDLADIINVDKPR